MRRATLSVSLLGVTIAFAAASVATKAHGQEPLIKLLTRDGILIRDGQPVSIPAPLRLTENSLTNPADLSGALDWDRFSRPSVVSPVWIDLDYVRNDSGQRLGHQVLFRFVVHESLDRMRERELLGELAGKAETVADGSDTDEKASFEEIDPTKAGMVDQEFIIDRRYGLVSIGLMNRVRLKGVLEFDSAENDGMIVLAWRLLENFDSDSRYHPTWASLERDDLGNQVEGKARAYRGAGGYIAVQSLAAVDNQLSDACLIEGRFVLNEPEEWFAGSNFLRSKLPLLIEEAARSFRRRLNQPPQ